MDTFAQVYVTVATLCFVVGIISLCANLACDSDVAFRVFSVVWPAFILLLAFALVFIVLIKVWAPQ